MPSALWRGFADGGGCGYVMIRTHDGKPVQDKEEGKEWVSASTRNPQEM